MTKLKNKTVIFFVLLILTDLPLFADPTQEPFLEAWHLYQKDQPQAGDLQRQIVFLTAQTQLTPDWAEPYRQLTDCYLQVGRMELAKKACQKYLVHQPLNVAGQMQLINIELQQYQMAEVRRQYLEQILNGRKDLLPEVISDLYRQLAQIAYENFQNDRAAKYLEFAIKRDVQNLRARQIIRSMVEADKQADSLQALWAEIGEYQARVMTNPRDGYAAFKLGTLAGKAGMSQLMQDWLEYAEKVRAAYDSTGTWPETLTLEAAESNLAAGQPKAAASLLEKVLSATPPETKPNQSSREYLQTQARILLWIGAVQLKDEKLARTQREWLDRLADLLKHSTADPAQLCLVSLFYSVYGEIGGKVNPAVALALAQNAIKAEPENRKAKLALALALARSGETKQSLALLTGLDKPADPLIMLGQILVQINNKKEIPARDLMAKALDKTPYGPLRECLVKMADRLALTTRLVPDFSKIHKLFKQVNPKTLTFQDFCRLTLKTRGEFAKGETVEVTGTLVNTTDFPLTIGPGGIISPSCVIEIQTIPAGNTKFFLDIPIDSRQILPPGKALTFTALLEQAVCLDRKMNWDGFVSGLSGTPAVKEISLQGKIYSQVTLARTTEAISAQSPLVTLQTPQLTPALASQIAGLLTEPIQDPWPLARLCRWVLETKSLQAHHTSITEKMIGQLKTGNNELRPAFAWALRSAVPDADLFNALAGQLNSKDWFTRLMTLDTLGQLQGKRAQNLFQAFAVKDPNDLVRQLSTGYLLYR
jgi:hypothetical protein